MNYDERIKELEQLAYHDSLTGLFNRNWLNENIYSEKFKYVYFFDINNLSKINDEKGHIAGDNYIKRIISGISIEENEILVRYAGDEFILLSNRSDALINNTLFSVGMSKIGSNLSHALMLADKKMLENKKLIRPKPNEGTTFQKAG